MNRKTVKLKTVALIVLAAWNITCFAQVETMMYVMKNGEIVFVSPVSGVDNVTFDEAAPDSTLIVHKNDGSPGEKILLNDIQQLSFSDESLSVEMSTNSEVYAFEDITKLFFGDLNTNGINKLPGQSGFDVFVSVTPAGDVTVESSVAIQSLTLFGIDGKIISKQQCDSGMQCIVSLKTGVGGIYLLRVETEQGLAVKKVVKPLSK